MSKGKQTNRSSIFLLHSLTHITFLNEVLKINFHAMPKKFPFSSLVGFKKFGMTNQRATMHMMQNLGFQRTHGTKVKSTFV